MEVSAESAQAAQASHEGWVEPDSAGAPLAALQRARVWSAAQANRPPPQFRVKSFRGVPSPLGLQSPSSSGSAGHSTRTANALADFGGMDSPVGVHTGMVSPRAASEPDPMPLSPLSPLSPGPPLARSASGTWRRVKAPVRAAGRMLTWARRKPPPQMPPPPPLHQQSDRDSALWI